MSDPSSPRLGPLAGYFLLAFVLTWGWQIPVYTGALPWGPWTILGPSAAGLLAAAIFDGPAGVVRLLKRIFTWRVGVQWYAVALLLMPAIDLVFLLLTPGGAAAWRSIAWDSMASRFATTFWFAAVSALFWEEIGWRGFALPRMQVRFGPLGGTLLLGLLWGLWHLTLWALDGSVLHSASTAWPGIAAAYGMYVGSVLAFSVFMTWALNHAHGSLLLAVLLHASINASIRTFPLYFPALTSPAVQAVEIMVAALIVVATRLRLGYDSSASPAT